LFQWLKVNSFSIFWDYAQGFIELRWVFPSLRYGGFVLMF